MAAIGYGANRDFSGALLKNEGDGENGNLFSVAETLVSDTSSKMNVINNITIDMRDGIVDAVKEVRNILDDTSILTVGTSSLITTLWNIANLWSDKPVHTVYQGIPYDFECDFCDTFGETIGNITQEIQIQLGPIFSDLNTTVLEIENSLFNVEGDILNETGFFIDTTVDVRDFFTDVDDLLTDSRSQVETYNNARENGYNIIFALPMIAIIWLLFGGVLKKPICFTCAYGLLWFSCTMMWALLAVHLPVAVLLNDSCNFLEVMEQNISENIDGIVGEAVEACFTGAPLVDTLGLSTYLNFTEIIQFPSLGNISDNFQFNQLDAFEGDAFSTDFTTFYSAGDDALVTINQLTAASPNADGIVWTRDNIGDLNASHYYNETNSSSWYWDRTTTTEISTTASPTTTEISTSASGDGNYSNWSTTASGIGYIRGSYCVNAVVIHQFCVSGAPHYDPEGDVCGNDGAWNEAYCSYGIGDGACAYCTDNGWTWTNTWTTTEEPQQPDSSECEWIRNNANTDGEEFVGYVTSLDQCVEMVQQNCSWASVANVHEGVLTGNTYAGCYCQYGYDQTYDNSSSYLSCWMDGSGDGYSNTETTGEYCQVHDDCPASHPFCFITDDGDVMNPADRYGSCASCDECHYCFDGVDWTCGGCGEGYPVHENVESCSGHSTDSGDDADFIDELGNKEMLDYLQNKMMAEAASISAFNKTVYNIRANLTEVDYQVEELQEKVQELVTNVDGASDLLNPLFDSVHDMENAAECGFVGDAYRDTKAVMCSGVLGALSRIVVAMFVIAILSMIGCIWSIKLVRKVDYWQQQKKEEKEDKLQQSMQPKKPSIILMQQPQGYQQPGYGYNGPQL